MIVDESMQSLLDYGKPDFPFAFYLDDAENPSGRSISWHWHSSLEFSYVSKGTLICSIAGEEINLSQGDAIFINSGVLHCFTLQKGCVLENVLFEPEFIAPKDSRVYLLSVLPYLQSNLHYHIFRNNDDNDQYLIKHIADCCAAARLQYSDSHAALEILTLVLILWNDFINQYKPISEKQTEHIISVSQVRTRKMLYFIYTHYNEKIGLSEISDAAGISEREALRCFFDFTSTTPVHFLNTYRLKCAEQLLRSGNKPISDIASETGYDNAGYFCKVFRKAYGTSPLQYRKRQP